MAVTQLTLQATTRTGLAATYGAAAAGGNSFDNSGQNVILHVKNGAASPITVTVGSTKTVDGRTLPALTVTVANGADKFIGPFPKDLYNETDSDNSLPDAVKITYSAVASVTVAALKVGSVSY